MYSKLLKHFSEKPVVYAPSTSPFWDDVHISKYMLEAHLAPQVESASRKLSFIKESVNWISDICILKEEKKILDLGCGAGIYSELFYKASFNVTGIDFSENASAVNLDIAFSLGSEYRIAGAHYVGLRLGYDLNVLSPLDAEKYADAISGTASDFEDIYQDNFSASLTYRYAFNSKWTK